MKSVYLAQVSDILADAPLSLYKRSNSSGAPTHALSWYNFKYSGRGSLLPPQEYSPDVLSGTCVIAMSHRNVQPHVSIQWQR